MRTSLGCVDRMRCAAVLHKCVLDRIFFFTEVLPWLQVKFSCEGVTISGIELEVQTSGAGKPVAKLTRRFQAGDYKVQWGE